MTDHIFASVYIITRNEEQNLRSLLPRLACFDEVVVVDCGSTDGTVDLARSFPNVVMSFRKWTGFSDQKTFALSLCSNDWVLNLDADEVPTDALMDAMRQQMAADQGDALQCHRVLLRNGRTPRGFKHHDKVVRFFRKRCGHYAPAKVHESITINGVINETTAELLHFEKLSYGQRIAKSNQYSDLKANDKLARGKRVGVLTLVLIFPVSFIQCYFGKGCFLDGIQGLLTSMNHAFYNFMKYAKLWELQQNDSEKALADTGKAVVRRNPEKLVECSTES
jgi:glycosyltransferase involved in cell wall biosynthesis